MSINQIFGFWDFCIVAFWQEVSKKVQSFAMLLHHEQEVVEALKKHLQVPKTMALDALTE